MTKFEIGDVVKWDTQHIDYTRVFSKCHHGPFVVVKYLQAEYAYLDVKPLDGSRFKHDPWAEHLKFYAERFVRDEFLTAAHKAKPE